MYVHLNHKLLKTQERLLALIAFQLFLSQENAWKSRLHTWCHLYFWAIEFVLTVTVLSFESDFLSVSLFEMGHVEMKDWRVRKRRPQEG